MTKPIILDEKDLEQTKKEYEQLYDNAIYLFEIACDRMRDEHRIKIRNKLEEDKRSFLGLLNTITTKDHQS